MAIIIALAGALISGLATWMAYGPGRLPDSVPHVVAGWATLAAGAYASWRAPWSRTGVLLAITGSLWFVGDFSTCLNIEPLSHRCIDLGPVGTLAEVTAWLWLGVLTHTLLAFPDGRVHGTLRLVLVVVGYAAALVLGSQPDPPVFPAALLVAVSPTLGWIGGGGSARRDRLPATLVGVGVGVAMLLREVAPVYLVELAVALGAVGLVTGLLEVDGRRAAITPDRAVGVRDELASALGDPTLTVAFRAPGRDEWVDFAGREVRAPTESGALAVTRVERDGELLAAVVHDATTLADPDVRSAVLVAVELAAHHARLVAELEAQVDEVDASRRRLLDAALRERRDLGQQVAVDVERPLERLASDLDAVARASLDQHVARAADQLEQARADVRNLAAGLFPRILAEVGLTAALRDLAARSPVAVELDVGAGITAGSDVDATIYFLCAEALANATRHAPGGVVRISVGTSGRTIAVEVQDDGPGGADETRGTGLRGLRDRVEALGGSLVVDSAAGMGTRLVATIPVGPEAQSPR